MFLHTSLSSSAKKNPNASLLMHWNVYCGPHKKHNFWKLMIYLKNCLCAGSPFLKTFSPVSEITAMIPPPNFSGLHTVRVTQSCTPQQDTFVTLLPFSPHTAEAHWSPGVVSAVIYFTPNDATEKGRGGVVTWGPGVQCPQHHLLLKFTWKGLYIKCAADNTGISANQ